MQGTPLLPPLFGTAALKDTGTTEGTVPLRTVNGALVGPMAWSELTNTPTTLSGYGITDAATSAQGSLADTAVQPGDLATVATTGSYTDLLNKPTITTGTVESVGLALPSQFTVTGSPVTSTGTLTAAWASQTQAHVLAAPSDGNGTPTFRALVATDIPTLNQNTTGTAANVTGIVAIANGGTGTNTAQLAINTLVGAVTSGQYLRGDGTNVVMSAIQAADIPTLNQNTTGTASNVTGIVAVANGGTGTSTAQLAINALAGAVTSGQYLRGDGTNVVMSAIQATDIPTLNQNTTGTAANVTGVVALANGGTGATTAQLAINALAGAVTSGQYLRGNGTNVVMSAIQAADVPTLNQNTTGTASNVTGVVALANGGTGATTDADARTNLGLAIGTNVQAYDADLAALAALTTTGLIDRTGDGTATTRATGATGLSVLAAVNEAEARTAIGVGAITNRNRLINGGMAIDQRNVGNAQTITAGAALAYTVDRWYAYCTGANVTGQRVQGATAGRFRYQFTGAASVTAIGFGQRIEQLNSADLAGTTATLSVDLANSLLTSVTWTAYYAATTDTFGTLASPTRTQIATGTFTVNSTVTRYSTQIAIPIAAVTGIEIVFTVGAQTSGTWIIGNVQLEPGSVATLFESRLHGTELALCQRYTFIGGNGHLVSGYHAPDGIGNFIYLQPFYYNTTMRANPTVSFSHAGAFVMVSFNSFPFGFLFYSYKAYTEGFQKSTLTSNIFAIAEL